MTDRAIQSVALAGFLAYVPVFIKGGVVARYGTIDNTRPRDQDAHTSKMPDSMKDLTQRLQGCHVNQLETLGFYAGGVALAVITKVPTDKLTMITSAYITSRVAYSVAYIAPQVGKGALRTLAFFASLGSCVWLYTSAANAASL